MLAQDKGNFHAHGKNRTRDPPVQWLERPILISCSIRRVVSSILASGTKIFFVPGEHGFSSFQVKMFTGSVCVLLTSVSLKLTKIKIKLIYATTSS